MTITTLKAAPQLYSATLSLIEKSFHYQKPQSFAQDFAPLIDESNWHNCFIKIENEKVLAHIGICERNFLTVPVAMLGGIAVDEARRGEGFFQELMQDVIAEKRSDVACFILWSDQEKLYKKFGFHLCGSQYEISQSSGSESYTKTKLAALNETQLKEVDKLYQMSFQSFYVSPQRNLEDWKLLTKISSADLFIKTTNSVITSYFFMNKGQDLQDVIYEYGSRGSLAELMTEIRPYGKVWTGAPTQDESEAQYQFFMAPADPRLFANLVGNYTKNQMKIEDINPMKQEVYFHFQDELLGLETEEFLRGVFGPGPFEELGDLKPIFISGLVSI
jgi:predicted N-acetyltransferase YhbS